MRMDQARKVQTAYTIFLAVLTVFVGLLFIVELADLYYAGPDAMGNIYTYERVGERLIMLLIPVGVWIVAIIGGFVLSVLLPREARRRPVDAQTAYKRLKKRIPVGEGEEFVREHARVKTYEYIRLGVWLFCLVFGLLAAVMSAVYIFDASNYVTKGIGITGVTVNLLKNIAPWVGVSFVLCIGAFVFEYFGARRMLPAAKRLLVLGKGKPMKAPLFLITDAERAEVVRWITLIFRVALGVLGLVFVVLGIFNGSATDVLYKAVMICTECIGLG